MVERSVAVSEAAAEAARERKIVAREPVDVVYPPFDALRFARRVRRAETRAHRLRAELHIPSDVPVLLSVGRIESGKAVSMLIQAVKALHDRGMDTTAIIVGTGTALGEVKALTEGLGLKQQVRFVGLQGDVAPWHALADVYVSGSEAEGLVGYSTLEALAAGTPVVATGIPAVRELLKEGRDCLLVTPRNVTEMAAAVSRLLKEPGLSTALATAAVQTVSQLTPPAHARRLDRVYRTVVGHD